MATQDKENKRLNLLIPQKLFDKFQSYSEEEYKSVTGKITEWMFDYVTDKEKATRNTKAITEAFRRLVEVIDESSYLRKIEDIKSVTQSVVHIFTKLLNDYSLATTPEFMAEILTLEQKISKMDKNNSFAESSGAPIF